MAEGQSTCFAGGRGGTGLVCGSTWPLSTARGGPQSKEFYQFVQGHVFPLLLCTPVFIQGILSVLSAPGVLERSGSLMSHEMGFAALVQIIREWKKRRVFRLSGEAASMKLPWESFPCALIPLPSRLPREKSRCPACLPSERDVELGLA